MSRVTLLTAAFLATTPAPSMAQNPAVEKIDGLVNWVYDYEQGRQLAKRTGKPMFVVFRCER